MGFDIVLGMVIGIALDLAIGWPQGLYRRIGHPVGWLAAWISTLERRLNRPASANMLRFVFGAVTSLSAIALAVLAWGGAAAVLKGVIWAPLAYGLLFWPLLALRSMHDHVAAVAKPLAQGDLAGARQAVSMIVGRDPAQLDGAGVARAALESLGENTSDGIIAPLFWGLLLGPAGMAGYKAVNTLDSMIAQRNARYEYFGKLAARIDDVANLVPARLTGLLFVIATPLRHWGKGLWIMWRDARRHRSPNAGWPETALAVGIGCRLSGPRSYDGVMRDMPWLHGDAPDPDSATMERGLALYRRAMGIVVCLLVIGLGAISFL